MVRLVIFDLDDTLYDTSPFFGCALANVASFSSRKYGISRGKLEASLLATLKRKGPQYKHLFDDSFAKFGVKLDPSDLKALLNVFYSPSCYRKMRLYPGVLSTIAGIRRRGAKVAIVTKGSKEKQRRTISQLGIGKLADKIFYSQSIGYEKTSTALWKHVFRTMRRSPRECICIGDNPATDLAVPRKLGAKTARLIKGFYGRAPKTRHEQHRIRSFKVLGPIFSSVQ